MGIEKELKYHLDYRQYARLLKACRKAILRRDRLTNYYFDDAELSLRKKRYGLRIRINGKKAVATLKFPAKARRSSVVGFKARYEYEDEIPFAKAQAVIKGKLVISELRTSAARVLKKTLPSKKLGAIRLLGSMKTHRTLAKISGFKMEIDKCEFFHKRFYELEVETSAPEKADVAVRKLFHDLKIPYRPLIKSKLGRFLDEWQKTRR